MDYSVDVENLSRSEVLEQLKEFAQNSQNRDTPRAKSTLKRELRASHPIHKFLNNISNATVKNISLHINLDIDTKKYHYGRWRNLIAKHCFDSDPKAPLTLLKGIIETLVIERNECKGTNKSSHYTTNSNINDSNDTDIHNLDENNSYDNTDTNTNKDTYKTNA